MSVYIISTMNDSVAYTYYENVAGLPVPKKKILIRGGAFRPSLKSGFGDVSQDEEGHPIWTAQGVCTPVSDEDYALLKDHWLFQKHMDSGHLKVVNHNISDDHKAVKRETESMNKSWKDDPSKQITPATLKERVGNKNLKVHEMSQDLEEGRI